MATYTLLTRNEYPSTDPQKMGQMEVIYVYIDDRSRTYTIQLPLPEDSPEKVEQELQAAVARAEGGGAKQIEI